MSKFAILGTGSVGQTLAARLTELGHEVMIGTRNVADTLARTDKDVFGNPPFSVWAKNHENIPLGTFAEAIGFGEILVNCTAGQASIPALKSGDPNQMKGKTLIDISNPLDFSQGFPPSLWVANTDSLGAQIQRTFPELNVVKTLNTMNAQVMVNPALIPGEHCVFLSGNNAGAKAGVAKTLKSFGWPDQSIIDVGDIGTACATEMLLPLWVRLYGALKTPMFNFNVNVAKP